MASTYQTHMANNISKSKVCEHCGVTYAPMSNRQRFCCAECVFGFWTTVDGNGCWIWGGAKLKSGYGSYQINGVRTTAHRLAYTTFVGPICSPLQFVCHRCDNPPCCNPDHLFLGTQTENMVDCANKGRTVRKLTEAQVREIRKAVGVSKAELGRRYGVTDVMIGKIIRNEWWKDVAR